MQKHPQGFFVRYFGLRGVALFEAAKGAAAVLASLWILSLRHKDMTDVADHVLAMVHKVLHVNPDRHFFHLLQHAIEGLTPRGLMLIAALVVAYAMIRFVEAAGLWLEKEWAEWFALITGALYMPIEVYELIRRPTPIKWTILSINVLIVLYVAWLLRDSHKRKKAGREELASKPVPS
jgi:uncharacterized membrane protein (DUF2068 family)